MLYRLIFQKLAGFLPTVGTILLLFAGAGIAWFSASNWEGSARSRAVGQEVPSLGASNCPWPSESGQHLLERKLGPLTFNGMVADLVRKLVEVYHVPISFIEIGNEAKAVTITGNTLKQILDQVVLENSEYRYRFFGPHLVLYSRDSRWETIIDNVNIGPRPRISVGSSLAAALRRKNPMFAEFGLPWIFGNPENFVYRDEVSLSGPASVVEMFTQLLGNRASAVFLVTKGSGNVMGLTLTAADLVRSLQLSAPTTTLREKGEQVQLSVVGVLHDGASQVLTAAECGTTYVVSNKQVVTLGGDGLVTAVGEGEAQVIAINETTFNSLTITVRLKKPKISTH